MNSFVRLVFIAAFLFLYLVAIIILKPMRYHVKRKYSTMALKFSYLIYLAIFLIFTYLFIFFNDIGSAMEDPNNSKAMFQFSLLLLSFLIPNTGILIRRRIKWRKQFNIIMSFINIIFGIYLWSIIEKSMR